MNTDGFYLIDKEVGWTSFDVCARLRKRLNTKKVGHTGTLDPFATGLLVVATGKCTRLIPFLEKARKKYRTQILLGKISETFDPESEIQNDFKNLDPRLRGNEGMDLLRAIMSKQFSGKITQIPPKYSALKFNGKKACDLAREGREVPVKERETEIFSWEILDFDPEKLTVEIELEVAAGFYVRSFARDLGAALGGGGMCQTLRRIGVGDLDVSDAENVEMVCQPIDPKFILSSLSQIEIPSGRVQDFIAGRSFPFPGVNGEKFLVLIGGKSLGMAEIIAGKLQPRVVL